MNKRLSLVNICLLSLLLTCAVSFAQSQAGQPIVRGNPTVNTAVHFDISLPLRELAKTQTVSPGHEEDHEVLYPKLALLQAIKAKNSPFVKDGALQSTTTTKTPATLGLDFLGVGVGFPNYSVPDAPPDVNLAVGDTQVVQWVNVSYAVFDKTSGAILAGPILGNALWQNFGGQCQNQNDGDIIPQWDKVAHRWVMHQNVFVSPYMACFAISTSPDALGTYYRYAFPFKSGYFPDYPKIGIWTNGYYQSNNIFQNGSNFIGNQPCAYERAKMLVGDSSALQICILSDPFDDSFLPGDIDSENSLPAAGMDEVLLGSIDNAEPGTNVYEYIFHADFVTPANSTLTGVNGSMPITVASYTGTCGGFSACIPQLGTSSKLDSLGDRLMYRLAYRKSQPPPNIGPSPFRPTQSFVVSHSVESNGSASSGERWYEFRSPLNAPYNLSVYQQGTYAPDSSYRWMGSIAMDKAGNMLLGYSTSSSTLYPSVNYAGRAASDPLGQLGTEGLIIAGTGSQLSTANRWGDYSTMAVDNNGCTMWYTQEYYTVPNSQFAWSTQIASFSFPNCH